MTLTTGTTVALVRSEGEFFAGTNGTVTNLDCGATADGTCCVEVEFSGSGTRRFVSVGNLNVVPTAEPVESLDEFKARVAKVFTEAADRAGVAGVPALLATLGIDNLAPLTRRRVFLTVEVEVEATSNSHAREVGVALISGYGGANVTDSWGGDEIN